MQTVTVSVLRSLCRIDPDSPFRSWGRSSCLRLPVADNPVVASVRDNPVADSLVAASVRGNPAADSLVAASVRGNPAADNLVAASVRDNPVADNPAATFRQLPYHRRPPCRPRRLRFPYPHSHPCPCRESARSPGYADSSAKRGCLPQSPYFPDNPAGSADVFRNRHIFLIIRRIHGAGIVRVHAALNSVDNSA